MREKQLTQKTRFVLLILDVVILCVASWVAFGRLFPAGDDNGFWFYAAMLGLILGSRLDTPFFAKPADVVLYAAPAAIALALGNSWAQWGQGVRVAYILSIGFCIVTGLLGAFAILTIDSKDAGLKRASNAARVLAETFGAPRTIYSIVIAFAVYAFHSSAPKEFGAIVAAWVLTGILSPLEGSLRIGRRLKRVFNPNAIVDADGEVVAYQFPGLVLVRESSTTHISSGDVLAVHDPLGQTRISLALDHVGRDEGLLWRTVDVVAADVPLELETQLSALPPNSVARIASVDGSISGNHLFAARQSIVGITAPDTTLEKLYFEVVKEDGVEEGRLVDVFIGRRLVTYQLVNGITREEIVQQKNTHGYARAQAQKIGEWDAGAKRFRVVKWLPRPNAPVFLKTTTAFRPEIDAIGHFPGTDYGVTLRRNNEKEVGLHSLVTHNTAILGILGVGKSSIALELVERMLAENIKVICLDLTNQYAMGLAPYYNAAQEDIAIKKLQSIGQQGKAIVKKNVEEGGSRVAFENEILAQLGAFIKGSDRLRIFNPAQFEVWKQDSKPYQDTASMATLTPAEITHVISDATLQIVSSMGMTDQARVCLVYEEAHSLVPEWNSAVAEGDRASSNGTARAILQGRKYGLGCILISQRTANVTKTILNQCNTIFAMRTFDETGKEFLANYLGREYADMLPSLEERHAVVFGRASNCENPVLIRVNDREDFLQAFRAAHPPALKAKGSRE